MTTERTPEEDAEWAKADVKEVEAQKSGEAERQREAKLLKEQIRKQGIFEKDERPNDTPY